MAARVGHTHGLDAGAGEGDGGGSSRSQHNKYVIMMLVNVMLMVLGCLMEWPLDLNARVVR